MGHRNNITRECPYIFGRMKRKEDETRNREKESSLFFSFYLCECSTYVIYVILCLVRSSDAIHLHDFYLKK